MVCHLSSAIKVTVLGPFISLHSEMPQELLSPNWLQKLLQKTVVVTTRLIGIL